MNSMNSIPSRFAHLPIRRPFGPVKREFEKKDEIWGRIKEYDITWGGYLKGTVLNSTRRFHDSIELDGTWIGATNFDMLLEEYKRYMLILTLVEGELLPPTVGVDYVWHAHLEYHDAYYGTWCGEVLGKIISHTPGIGTAEELREGYRRYRAYYQYLFDSSPVERWKLGKTGDIGIFYEINQSGEVAFLGDCG